MNGCLNYAIHAIRTTISAILETLINLTLTRSGCNRNSVTKKHNIVKSENTKTIMKFKLGQWRLSFIILKLVTRDCSLNIQLAAMGVLDSQWFELVIVLLLLTWKHCH